MFELQTVLNGSDRGRHSIDHCRFASLLSCVETFTFLHICLVIKRNKFEIPLLQWIKIKESKHYNFCQFDANTWGQEKLAHHQIQRLFFSIMIFWVLLYTLKLLFAIILSIISLVCFTLSRRLFPIISKSQFRLLFLLFQSIISMAPLLMPSCKIMARPMWWLPWSWLALAGNWLQ